MNQFLPKIDMFVTSALGPGTRHNSWHLQTLAVDPEYQRKGVATLLINTIADKASLTGTMLCLEAETERNVCAVQLILRFELINLWIDRNLHKTRLLINA
jgi:GNAT superfamily N-acetyltransferase